MTRGSAATSRTRRLATRICVSTALAGLFVVGLAETTQTAIANGDTRTLSFYHTHSKERLTVTFKKDGRYDPAALKKLNYYLRDWRNQKQTNMEPRLFDVLWEVQKDAGSKAPIHIISSYRSSETNEGLRRRSKGVAKNSQHTLGRAMDIHVPDVPMSKIREAGLRLQRGGVGFYPSSGIPFVHLDVGNVRHWPRMTRDQLVRLFPDGRTVHLPADGKPLKNYALALADVAKNGGTARGMSETQVAMAQRAQKSGAAGKGGGFLSKFIGNDNEEDDAPSAPEAAPAAAAPEAPVALAAIEQSIPMPEPRPSGVAGPDAAAGGPQLASAYAPQDVPAPVPNMIWRSGPDAGRAATTYQAPPTTPGYATAMPEPRPSDTTPSALAAHNLIQPGAMQPVTASLAPSASLEEQKREALRLLGRLTDADPEPAPAPQPHHGNRVAAAFDSFGPAQTASIPAAVKRAPAATPQVAVQTAAYQETPTAAFVPERSARNRDLAMSHPNARDSGLIVPPSGVLPASFGGNPNAGMRSDIFAGTAVPSLRVVSFGPQRTAQLSPRG